MIPPQDRKLIEQARRTNDPDTIWRLQQQAQTEQAREILRQMRITLHHKEEHHAGLL